MSKSGICLIVFLSIMWILLTENISIAGAATGIAVSVVCVVICSRLIPLPKTPRFRILICICYSLCLAIQIYTSAINAIKIIITGGESQIVHLKTCISNSFLRTVLANSFTLTPGSLSLDLHDDTITVLWLKGKRENCDDAQKAADAAKCRLEKILIKAEI